MNLKKNGLLSIANFRSSNHLSFTFFTIFLIALGSFSFPAVAADNPFANIPKASEFLGNPKEFVAQIEGRVMPVLIQFFTGIAMIYSLSQLIKSLKNK